MVYAMLLSHVSHGFDVVCLALVKLLGEVVELGVEHTDIIVDALDVGIDGVDRLLTAVHVGTYALQVLEFLLHLCLVGTQSLFLLANILLDASLLVAQSADGLGLCLGTRGFLLCSSLFALHSLRCDGFLRRLLVRLCGGKRQREGCEYD